jgi:hypothetical protein
MGPGIFCQTYGRRNEDNGIAPYSNTKYMLSGRNNTVEYGKISL